MPDEPRVPCASPPLAIALLGASNLTLALPRFVRAALDRVEPGREVTLLVAHGPGRSWGIEAGPLGLRYPPLGECGLWKELERLRRRAARPGEREIRALLTDIGNDVVYGCGVEPLLGWIDGALARLADLGARASLTRLPLRSVERIPAWKYRLLRPLYFPGRPMPLQEARRQVRAVEAGLEEISRGRGARLLEAPRDGYGFDHFHLSARGRRAAAGAWLDALLGPPARPPDAPPPPLPRRLRRLTRPPATRRGRTRPAATPVSLDARATLIGF